MPASVQEDATPVLILGMPRSGTTLIEQILSRHRRVGAAGELTFWNVEGRTWDRGGLSVEVARRMISAYQMLLREHAPEAARVTDKMPYNFQWIGLARILFPNARFIHVRRDPVDTCLSVYRTLFDFDQGWMSSRENLVRYYRQYARLMAHWRTVVPSDRLLEVDYETLVTAQEAETRRMVAFCGLDWDDACLHPERSRSAIRTASLWQARQAVTRARSKGGGGTNPGSARCESCVATVSRGPTLAVGRRAPMAGQTEAPRGGVHGVPVSGSAGLALAAAARDAEGEQAGAQDGHRGRLREDDRVKRKGFLEREVSRGAIGERRHEVDGPGPEIGRDIREEGVRARRSRWCRSGCRGRRTYRYRRRRSQKW